MKKDLLSSYISASDCIGKRVQSLFAEVGLPVVFLSHKENAYLYKAYFQMLNLKQLTSLERAFKAVKFVLLSKYPNISLSPDLDGIYGATFAVLIEKAERTFIPLAEVKEPLKDNEYFLGIDEATGEVVKNNLLDCPHLLIAGASGSGKSTLLHNIISSFLDKKAFDNVAFTLIDTKKIEFSRYKAPRYADDIYQNIATDIPSAFYILSLISRMIDDSYSEMAKSGETMYKGTKQVVIIDEFADLIARGNDSLERLIIKIAQLGRACGVHLIIATQRPSATVCTGLIKANIPCRIAFQCASKVDSRVVIEQNGAELLRGKGEALYRDMRGRVRKIQCFS